MRIMVVLVGFLGVLVGQNLALAGAGGDVSWGYSGATGPLKWGTLSPKYALCQNGEKQSPIDLKWKKVTEARNLQFFYHKTPVQVLDNGHTIQVNVPPGNTVKIDGAPFELLQFHFHAESEHTLSGKRFPLIDRLWHIII